jgi:hypothetical protein
MPEDTPPNDPFETIITAYADATTADERRTFLRAAVRTLHHDAELHAARLRLLLVAAAAEVPS